MELNLSNIKLKQIDFLLNNSFKKLKNLNLDSNEIEDISILSNENLGILNVDKVSIKSNPIKKGLNSFINGIFFNRCLFIELGIYKKEEEFKISAQFIHFNIDIDFFVSNINELKNYFDFNNNYIKLVNTNIKIIEDEIKPSENNQQFELILYILNKGYNQLSIYYEKVGEQIENYNYDKIIINENNIKSFENIFKLLQNKSFYLSKFSFIINLCLYNFNLESENIIQYLPFHYVKNLSLYNCSLDLNIFQHTKFYNLKELDLSNSYFTDIKGLCGDVPFSEKLEVLNLKNNNSITNLDELKNAKFTELKELYLSYYNSNLDDIKIKFSKLKIITDPHIIIDISNDYFKAGLSVYNMPAANFPACYFDKLNFREKLKALHNPNIKNPSDILIGDNALTYTKRYSLKAKYPTSNGIDYNWDEIEKMLEYTFNKELNIDPVDYNILLSEASLTPKNNRERMAQIMFETFNAPGLFLQTNLS